MQVIAITGASSFIGTHFLKHLSARSDLRFRLLVNRNRNVSIQESKNVSIIHGNLLESETLNDFVETGCIVINLAYLGGCTFEENLIAINNLMEVCSKVKIKRLIHCSTAVVSGRVSTNKVSENTVINPIQEYEATKSKIEKIVLERSDGLFETVILRPTAVFGEGGKNLIKLANSLMYGNKFINFLKSCVYQYRRMNLVYVGNVVSSIEFAMDNNNIDREVFIISDDEDPSNNYRAVERYMMKEFGCKAYLIEPISLPFPILKLTLRLAGRTNVNPALVYDCGKIIALGLQKPVSFNEGLSLFSKWFIKMHCHTK